MVDSATEIPGYVFPHQFRLLDISEFLTSHPVEGKTSLGKVMLLLIPHRTIKLHHMCYRPLPHFIFLQRQDRPKKENALGWAYLQASGSARLEWADGRELSRFERKRRGRLRKSSGKNFKTLQGPEEEQCLRLCTGS